MVCVSKEEILIMKKIINTVVLFAFVVLMSACSKEDDQASKATTKDVKVIDAVVVDASKKADSSKTDSSGKIEVVGKDGNDQTDQGSNIIESTLASYVGRELKVLDISERSYDGGNAITVTFSVPLDTSKKISEYFSVSDSSDGNAVDGAWELSKNGKQAYFPHIQPSNNYKIKVYPGLIAINNKKLGSPHSAEINTRKVTPSYSFASKGSFLPLQHHSGLPVMVVNTPEVNVDFFKVKKDRVAQFLSLKGSFKDQIHRYRVDRVIKEAELKYSARYRFDAEKNKRREFNLPVQSIKELAEPGIYVALMSVPAMYNNQIRMTYFTVTDIGVHTRVYGSRTEVHLSSLNTGKPLKGVKVSMLDRQGRVVESSMSSPDGQASLGQYDSSHAYLIAEASNQMTIVPFNGPALDLSEFELGSRPHNAQEFFIYGPRDLYRPGGTVIFNGLLRNDDGRVDSSARLNAVIKQPNGQIAHQFRWAAEELSFYNEQYTLASDAMTGEWRLEVSNVGTAPVVYKFKVEEFLPERMKLTFNPGMDKRFYKPNETLKVKVLGEYLYGAPANGNRFESRINMSLNREPFEQLKGFKFGDLTEKDTKLDYTLPDITLSETGEAEIEIEKRWGDVRSPMSVTLLGSLYETGGRPITRRHRTTIWPVDKMIGIRPGFKKNPQQNSRIRFDLVMANAKGEMLAASNLEVALIREDRRYFWEYNQRRGWHYEWSDKEYTEYNTNISVKKGKAAKLEVPVEYGSYRLEVRDTDNNTMSSVRFYAGRNWYYWWKHNESGQQAARPDKVSLALDKASYVSGENAVVSIVPPAAGEAIVMVESDEPLMIKRISVPAEGMKLKIPIEKSWNRHDLYISVVHLQQTDAKKKITPTRSFGLIHLPLNREKRKLAVSFDVNERIFPNQKYEIKLKVDGAEGQKTRLTLAMVDVGVLSITDFKTPEPHNFFFEPRRYQVDSRDMYNDLIKLNDFPMAKQRYGGDAQLSRGGKQAQAEVQIVSLYSGLVSVDKNGDARVTFDVPDFNGRVRLMAIAFTEDRFGSGEQEMRVAAPLVTQLAMPRFLAMGDQSTFALDVHNLTDESQKLKVKLDINGPVSFNQADNAASKVQTVTLKKNEKTTLLYPVKVDYLTGRSQVDLEIKGIKNFKVKREWGIQVRAAYPAVTRSKRGLLKEDESLELEPAELKEFVPSTVEAVLSLNNSVDLKMREQMTHLLRYPYGCLEQSTSSTYPWLFATDENLKKMGLTNKTTRSRNDSIKHGLARIESKLLNAGGYGLWSNTGNEQHWLTAYVGDFLSDAREQGVTVNDNLYNKTMDRLNDYVRQRNGNYGNRWSSNPGHYDLAYRAYAAYVLSRHNNAHLASLRSLAEHKLVQSQSFLPLIHLGLALINQGDEEKGKTLLTTAMSKKRGQGYFGDYGSGIRDMAQAIHLLVRHKREEKYTKQLALALADKIKQRTYLSTQERNALFLAALALDANFSEDWSAEIKLSEAVDIIKKRGSYSKKYEQVALEKGLSVTNKSDSTLYAQIDYLGYTKTAPEAEQDSNLGIERNYYNTRGEPIDPSQLKVGDLVLVGLRISTAWRAPDVLVVDLLPAGLELENQNLNHAIKLDEIEFDGKPVKHWMEQTKVVHQEYRDDRYVAAIDANYGYVSHLYYLARAVTPGTYLVPASLVEDMYRAEDRAIGATIPTITIKNP